MKNLMCKLGFHRFEKQTKRNGWVDCGDHVMCMEETSIGCTRDGCKKTKGVKKGKWITFKKENTKKMELNIQINKGDDFDGELSKKGN